MLIAVETLAVLLFEDCYEICIRVTSWSLVFTRSVSMTISNLDFGVASLILMNLRDALISITRIVLRIVAYTLRCA